MSNTEEKSMEYWKITIFDWGTLYGIGTKEEAEAWKEAKEDWEGSGGKLEPAKKEDSNDWRKLRDLLPRDWQPEAKA